MLRGGLVKCVEVCETSPHTYAQGNLEVCGVCGFHRSHAAHSKQGDNFDFDFGRERAIYPQQYF